MIKEQEHRGEMGKRDFPEETAFRLPDHGSGDESKHGPLSGTDLILKNLLIFGSAALVISAVLYLVF